MRRFLAIAAFAFLATGCGGGGGGGTNVSNGSGVRMVSATPAQIEAQSYEGMSPPSVTFRVNFDGDLQTLTGKALYIFFEVPDPLFEAQPIYRIDTVNKYVEITLQGRLSGDFAQGVYEKSLRIIACLDAACNSQLGNSPYSLPYKITILPGLKLSPETVSFATLFGVTPTPVRVNVQVPQGATSWDLFSYNGSQNLSVVKAADGSASIDVTPSLTTPGVYSATYSVQTTLPNPVNPGSSLIMQKQLNVRYDVQPNAAVVMAFSPAIATYQLKLNDPQQKQEFAGFSIALQDGSYSRTGAVYVSAPAEAANHPNVGQWLSANLAGSAANQYSIIPCGTDPSALNCLPAGTYSAAIRFKHTSSTGIETDVDYPIQMTISP